METAPLDEIQGVARLPQVGGAGPLQQRHAVVNVPRSACQDLEGEEMAEPSHRDEEPREGLEQVRHRHDLGLDARRGEQEVHAEPFAGLIGRKQLHCGEAPHILLLQDRLIGAVTVAATADLQDDSFRFSVACHGDGDVQIPGDPRPGSYRNREAADDGPGELESSQIRVEPAQSAFEAVQRVRPGGAGAGVLVGSRPLQPVDETPLDPGVALAGVLAAELLAHELLGQLVELRGGTHALHEHRVADQVHEQILSDFRLVYAWCWQQATAGPRTSAAQLAVPADEL